jgi:PKD repeat protein
MTTFSGSGSASKIYIGVTTTSNPLDEWIMYWFDPDETNQTWFDYPNLGFNKNWMSIGGIMRDSNFDPIDYVVFTIDIQAIYAGDENINLGRFTTPFGSAIVPAITYDTAMEELYLISTGDGNDGGEGFVNLFKISGAVDDPDFEMLGSVGVPEPWENWSYEYHGDFLPQKGSDHDLNSIDARMQTMVVRNNKLWAVHHIYVPADDPTRTAVQWWNFDTTGVLLERGRIEDETNNFFYAFPSIAVNKNDDIIIGHGIFSKEQYAGAGYSYRAHYDEVGSMREYYQYKEGLAPYYKTYGGNRNRWGDYSAVFVDPVHDINFWAMNEYADLPSGNDRWATYWAYIEPQFVPEAGFIADATLLPLGETVSFTDLTLGVPDGWEWTFETADPATSDVQNPDEILFTEEGSFDVKLIATNVLGADTIVKEDYITTSTTILPDVDFIADKAVVCTGDEVQFTDLTAYLPNQWEWQFEPSTVTFVDGTDQNSQNPVVIFNEAETYNVQLTCWNLNGSSALTQNNMVYAGGYAPYYKETFETGSFREEDWTVENPDGDMTWENYEIGGTVPGFMAAGIDFYNYFFFNERDRLITPPFNLENMSGATLSFQHAYAQRYDTYTDSLLVYVSDDCGNSWTKVFLGGENGSGNFATHEMADGFWPAISDDWCLRGWGASCITIDLSNWVGKANVKIAFESVSAFGNPLFIDNVEISQFVDVDELSESDNNLVVYPNPADGSFNVEIGSPENYNQLDLVNHLGQLVYSTKLDGKVKTILINPEKDWNTGIYFLKVSGTGSVISKKVILY